MRWFLCALVVLAACKRKVEERRGAATAPPDATEIQPYIEDGPCPYGFMLPEDKVGRCTCAPDRGGYAYGTGQYSQYADICVAARHAGALDATGVVTVARSGGCSSYRGTTRNGITSTDDNAASASFFFPGFTEPGCSQVIDAAAPASGNACPAVLPLAADGTAPKLTCHCMPPIPAGPVWGSGPYALDSAPCAAAVHAGAIEPSGGDITVERTAGCAHYTASVRHGVAARASDATPEAFHFAGATDPCPQ